MPARGFPIRFGLLLAAGLSLWAPVALSAADEAVARRLLNSQGCKACHPFESDEEASAPDLSRIGSRLTREQLRSRLVTPDHRHAGGRIADFRHLSDAEIEALVSFLGRRQ